MQESVHRPLDLDLVVSPKIVLLRLLDEEIHNVVSDILVCFHETHLPLRAANSQKFTILGEGHGLDLVELAELADFLPRPELKEDNLVIFWVGGNS